MDERQLQEAFMRRLDELEANCLGRIDERMNAIQNSLLYIAKLMEGGGAQVRGIVNGNDKWRDQMGEKIRNLVRMDVGYKNFNSVLRAIYVEMRNVYGIVIDQLRKDYKDTYGLDQYPSALVAIGDNSTCREIFSNILTGLFPADVNEDPGMTEPEDTSDIAAPKTREEEDTMQTIRDAVTRIATALGDRSVHMNRTWRMVYERMGFQWHNLQVRYAKKNGLKRLPQNITIIASNSRVHARFKKILAELEDELTQSKTA